MHRKTCSDERGISLVEVVVALGIFSVVLISLTGLMFTMARQSRLTAYSTARTAAVQSASAWAQGVPWDSIGAATGCVADTAGALPYTRCTSVQTVSQDFKQLQVIITPSSASGVRADTVVVSRAKPQNLSPLYVP